MLTRNCGYIVMIRGGAYRLLCTLVIGKVKKCALSSISLVNQTQFRLFLNTRSVSAVNWVWKITATKLLHGGRSQVNCQTTATGSVNLIMKFCDGND